MSPGDGGSEHRSERSTLDDKLAYTVGALCGVQLGHERPYRHVFGLLARAPRGTRLPMLRGMLDGFAARLRRPKAVSYFDGRAS